MKLATVVFTLAITALSVALGFCLASAKNVEVNMPPVAAPESRATSADAQAASKVWPLVVPGLRMVWLIEKFRVTLSGRSKPRCMYLPPGTADCPLKLRVPVPA